MVFDPPWRFDPYQNPKEVQWGGYYCLFQIFAPNVIGGSNVIGPNNHVVKVALKNGATMAHERNQNIESGGISFYEGIFLIDVPGVPTANKGAFVTFTLNGNVYSEGDPAPPQVACAYAVGTPGRIVKVPSQEVISTGLPLDLYNSSNWYAGLNAGQDALTAFMQSINPAYPPFPHFEDPGQNFVFMRYTGSTNPGDWARQKDINENDIPCTGTPDPPPLGAGPPTNLSSTVQWFLYPKGGHKVQASDKYFPIRTTDNQAGIDLLDGTATQSNVSDGEITFAISSERAFRAEDLRLPFVYPLAPMAGDPSTGMNPVPYSILGFRRSVADPFEDTQWGLETGFAAFAGPPGPGPY